MALNLCTEDGCESYAYMRGALCLVHLEIADENYQRDLVAARLDAQP